MDFQDDDTIVRSRSEDSPSITSISANEIDDTVVPVRGHTRPDCSVFSADAEPLPSRGLPPGVDDTVLRGCGLSAAVDETVVGDETVVRDDTVVRDMMVVHGDTIVRDKTVAGDDTVVRVRTDFADAGQPVVAPSTSGSTDGVVSTPVCRVAPRRCFNAFRLNGADVFSLDVRALIGRRPSLSRVADDDVPRLCAVDSPGRQVSATHIELRQEGDVVVVTDVCSTNGTVVNFPGRGSVRMGRGESLVVPHGTVISIGDGNLVEILPL